MKQYAPLIIFLATLLPLGLGHTLFGTSAAMFSALVVGLSLSLFSMFVVLSYLGEKRLMLKYILQPAEKLIFHTPEKTFVIVVAALFFCTAFAISYFSNACTSAIQDSVAQLIHARILLSGHVSLPAYPLGEFFNLGVVVNDGRYYSQYPPGHILWLALGELVGVACSVNPLLGALTCITIFFLAKEIYGQKVARIGVLLCLSSPFLLRMSAEFMNHATALLFATLFLFSFIKAVKNPASGWALVAGFSIAYVGITRPLTAVGIVFPAVLYSLYLLYVSPRHYLPRFFFMACGACAPLLFLLWFNSQTTGDVLAFAYQKLPMNAYGFGLVPVSMLQWVSQPEHTLWHGVGMAFNTLNMLHWSVFNWPTSSLVFVLLVFMFRKPKASEWLLLATIFSLLAIYVPYYFQAGSRFIYEIIGILIVFTAYGISRVPEVLSHWPRLQLTTAQVNMRLAFVMLCCTVFSAGFTIFMLNSEGGRAEKLLAANTLASRIDKPTLLFMPFDQEYWRLAGIYYPVREDSLIIVAADRGEDNKKLMVLYPKYDAYRARDIGTDKEVWEKLKRD